MITIQLTEAEANAVLFQSPVFRTILLQKFSAVQTELAKGNEPDLFSSFKTLVKSNVRPDNKIQWIKNTRQWALDNKAVISTELYNQLYSFKGAKDFVEAIMGLPRY
jgi:hypothetical protein